jgi:Zn-dependent protease
LQHFDPVTAVFEFVILIFSLCVHECAHAWTASRLGDQTARLQGRVTLNPMYHVDPIGTLLFPAIMIFGGGFFGLGGFLVGWAKPTPVITRNFRRIVRDDNLVTLAGPASNLFLALLAFLLLAALILTAHGHMPDSDVVQTNAQGLGQICFLAIQINLALFFFNLLPIPPLDGSHILRHFLPYNLLNYYDRIGMFGLLLMVLLGGPILGLLLPPAMKVVFFALQLVQSM